MMSFAHGMMIVDCSIREVFRDVEKMQEVKL